MWEDGALVFHTLRGARYVAIARSELLPTLEPALIIRCLGARSQTAAAAMLRVELRRG